MHYRGVFGMPGLSCTSCRAKFPDFCTGNLGWRDERRVIKHLRQCDACLQLAERHKMNTVPHSGPTPVPRQPDKPSQGQALAKWGTVLFVCVCVVSLMCFAYDALTHDQAVARVRDWVDLRYV